MVLMKPFLARSLEFPWGAKLTQVGVKLGQVGVKLGQVGAKLGQVGVKLSQVGAKLGPTWDNLSQLGARLTKEEVRVVRPHLSIDHIHLGWALGPWALTYQGRG